MRESARRSTWITAAKLTGFYAATTLLAIAAAHGTAAYHGIHDARAGEMSLIAVMVFAPLWMYSLYRITAPLKSHG